MKEEDEDCSMSDEEEKDQIVPNKSEPVKPFVAGGMPMPPGLLPTGDMKHVAMKGTFS